MKFKSEKSTKTKKIPFSAVKKTAALFLAVCACILPGISQHLVIDASAASGVIMPSYIFDFTDFETYSLDYYANCTVDMTDTGIRCTATADDPYISIGTPAQSGKNLVWMVIKYRGKTNVSGRGGEMYFTTHDKPLSESTAIRWQWGSVSTEWKTVTFKATTFGSVSEPVLYMRYDPLSGAGGALSAGEWIETAYIAFFRTESAAKNFDYDKYYANKELPAASPAPETWEKPPQEYGTVAMDNDDNGGTLKIKESDTALKISYVVDGKKYSYDLNNDAFLMNGVLAGTDDLGRSQPDQFTVIDPDYVGRNWFNLPTDVDSAERIIGVRGANGKRYVGIFYFLWHGTQGDWGEGPRNISKIMEEYGTASKDMPELWGRVNNTFFFAEPLYGYYRATDTWVLRKHMELLTNAGIDFLYFDTTNNYIYQTSALSIMKICHEMNEQGYKAPQVVFYTHTDAAERVMQAYTAIYEKNLYPDTWFMLDGKPLIIAPAAANINGFFTTREPQWPTDSHGSNAWPWMDWKWPQETYGANNSEAISVSVAQHSGNGEFSTSALYGYTKNRGRSYNGRSDSHTDDSYKQGTNLQLQFNRAIASDVPYVLVTGWNEWIAGRQEPNSKYSIRFIDTFDYEYSRDIEMTRGGYFDNYYMQLASNVAAIKGSAPIIVRDDRRHINITGDFGQWEDVAHYYTDPEGDAPDRNTVGYGGVEYKNDTGRNDVTKIKVTGDTTYLYFYIECAESIVHGDGGSWMQILLNTDNASTGWYGYDYIVNYTRKNDYTSTVAAYNGMNGAYSFKARTDITYQVNGNKMMVAVPLEAIGVSCYDRIDLQFKVTDSDNKISTMEQLYEDGDAAPLGRLNFTYKTYLSSVQSADGQAVVPVSEREFLPPAETETETDTEPVTDETETGDVSVRGDINRDGAADNKDVVELFRYVSRSSGYDAAYDYNEDKEVNNKDVIALFRDLSST